MEKLTQIEIYNHLHLEVMMKQAFRVNPSSPDNFLDIASRQAHLYAVKNTWYWFNNQELLEAKCFYQMKKGKQK